MAGWLAKTPWPVTTKDENQHKHVMHFFNFIFRSLDSLKLPKAFSWKYIAKTYRGYYDTLDRYT